MSSDARLELNEDEIQNLQKAVLNSADRTRNEIEEIQRMSDIDDIKRNDMVEALKDEVEDELRVLYKTLDQHGNKSIKKDADMLYDDLKHVVDDTLDSVENFRW